MMRENFEAQVQAKPFQEVLSEYSIVITEEVPYAPKQRRVFYGAKQTQISFLQFASWLARKVIHALAKQAGQGHATRAVCVRSAATSRPVAERTLRLLATPSVIHFWGKHITWDGIVDEVVDLENRELVFSDWWENALERVYYKLETRSGRQLWLFRTAEGDFLHGEFH